MPLTPEQHAQIRKQLEKHCRASGLRTIALDEHTSLELLVEQGVFGSDIMSSGIYLARFLYQHPELYLGKDAADIGCGPGTQGIVMAKYGAKSVVFSDINPRAVTNTQKNIAQQHLTNAEVYLSYLFDNIPDRTYDLIVFNHPFFSGKAEEFEDDPNQDEMLRRGMLGGTELLPRFFQEVPKYLRKDGRIIMPYFHFAGPENNPSNHVDKYNLKIARKEKIGSEEGLQLGNFSIYVIRRDTP